MHSKDRCHHDVKPGNMLLDEHYRVKLCDLDSVKDLKAAKSRPRKALSARIPAVRGARVFERWHCLRCQMRCVLVCHVDVRSGYRQNTFRWNDLGTSLPRVADEDSRPTCRQHVRSRRWQVHQADAGMVHESDDRPSMPAIVHKLQRICEFQGLLHYKPRRTQCKRWFRNRGKGSAAARTEKKDPERKGRSHCTVETGNEAKIEAQTGAGRP